MGRKYFVIANDVMHCFCLRERDPYGMTKVEVYLISEFFFSYQFFVIPNEWYEYESKCMGRKYFVIPNFFRNPFCQHMWRLFVIANDVMHCFCLRERDPYGMTKVKVYLCSEAFLL